MKKHKVSVIIPVYNSALYIPRLLDSIEKQTYANCEYIFVNDGSTDNSGMILKEYLKNRENMYYIEQENGGAAAARNRGIEAASGDYLSFVDSDDYILPHFIEAMVAEAERTNADIVLTGVAVEKNGEITEREHEQHDIVKDRLAFMRDIFLKINASYIVCNKLFKRAVFEQFRFLEGYIFEDMFASYMTALSVSKVAYLTEDLYIYCVREQSVFTTGSNRQFSDFAHLAGLIFKAYLKKGLGEPLAKEMTSYIDNGIVRMQRVYERSDPEKVSQEALEAAIRDMEALRGDMEKSVI